MEKLQMITPRSELRENPEILLWIQVYAAHCVHIDDADKYADQAVLKFRERCASWKP